MKSPAPLALLATLLLGPVFGGLTLSANHERLESPGLADGVFNEAGEWKHIRWLNGDQAHQGRHVRLEPGRFTLQRVKLYRYR